MEASPVHEPGGAAPALSGSKKYKPSRFNAHTTAPDASVILYNTFSGHCCVIPAPCAIAVSRYLSQRGFEGVLDGVGEYLLDAGYIVESGFNELMRWDVVYGTQRYRSDALILVLLASEDCNFRCVYCSQPFRRGTMLPSVRSGVRRYIQGRIAKLKLLSTEWFGGEPLLGYEAIEELAPFFQKMAQESDVTYTSGITTNGYLLTPDRARAMLRWGIVGYQITLDGLPDEHDAKRPLKEGGPTFQTIMKNLAGMRQLSEPFEVRLRVNFDRQNIGRLRPYFELVRERLADDPRFRIAFNPVGRWGGSNDDKLNVFTTEVLERQAALREEARNVGLPVESAMFGLKNVVNCGATLAGSLIIGADGRIIKCTNYGVFPERINVLGHVLEDGTLKIDSDRNFRWLFPYYNYDPKCRKCFYLPICKGGIVCPAARVQGLAPQCPDAKMHIRSLLLEYWRERRVTDGGKRLRLQMAAPVGKGEGKPFSLAAGGRSGKALAAT